MVLSITHLDKKRDENFDQYFKDKFFEHIINQFDINKKQLKANLTVSSAGVESLLTLHFHYHKQHFHLHSHSQNLFESGQSVISELEKKVIKDNGKNKKRIHGHLRGQSTLFAPEGKRECLN